MEGVVCHDNTQGHLKQTSSASYHNRSHLISAEAEYCQQPSDPDTVYIHLNVTWSRDTQHGSDLESYGSDPESTQIWSGDNLHGSDPEKSTWSCRPTWPRHRPLNQPNSNLSSQHSRFAAGSHNNHNNVYFPSIPHCSYSWTNKFLHFPNYVY